MYYLVTALFAFCIGMFVGARFFIPAGLIPLSLMENRESGSSFTFISPLLACESEPSATSQAGLVRLQNKLQAHIDAEKRSGAITEAGVYFRELKYGGWIGVNENLMFTPGSLLKVPLIMSVYEYREEHPEIAEREYVFATSSFSFPLNYPPQQKIHPEKPYTLDELVRATLLYSDNDAALVLSGIIDESSLLDSYERLGIISPRIGADYQTSVKSYASFFRILYNATYISRKESEYILSLLSQSSFRDGLVAGVPADVPVAHKFGERMLDGNTVQLHDCGIVYTKPNPYVMCVMTHGKDFSALEQVIGELSKTVFEEMQTTQSQ